MPTYFNETAMLRKTLLHMIQSDLKLPSNSLKATNVWFLFNRKDKNLQENTNLHEIREFKLNKSCKIFHIHFQDSSEFDIFEEEFNNLSIGEDKHDSEKTDEQNNIRWYQSRTYVKGFNDILVNNKSIWFEC
jgi:hypothetical protein